MSKAPQETKAQPHADFQTAQPGQTFPPAETQKAGEFSLEQNPQKYDAPPNTLDPNAPRTAATEVRYDPRTGQRLDELPPKRVFPDGHPLADNGGNDMPDYLRHYILDMEDKIARLDKNVFGAGGG